MNITMKKHDVTYYHVFVHVKPCNRRATLARTHARVADQKFRHRWIRKMRITVQSRIGCGVGRTHVSEVANLAMFTV